MGIFALNGAIPLSGYRTLILSVILDQAFAALGLRVRCSCLMMTTAYSVRYK